MIAHCRNAFARVALPIVTFKNYSNLLVTFHETYLYEWQLASRISQEILIFVLFWYTTQFSSKIFNRNWCRMKLRKGSVGGPKNHFKVLKIILKMSKQLCSLANFLKTTPFIKQVINFSLMNFHANKIKNLCDLAIFLYVALKSLDILTLNVSNPFSKYFQKYWLKKLPRSKTTSKISFWL